MRLMLVDGFNLLSRYYFATERRRALDPEVTLKGLLRKVDGWTNEFTHIAFFWDGPIETTHRFALFPDYKATRTGLPEPLFHDYVKLRAALTERGIFQSELAGYEADDLMGAVATAFPGESYMYSSDRDLHQLLSPNVFQIVPKKGEELLMSRELFEATYGVRPLQFVDVKALQGDASDNIPGVKGIGPKTATILVQSYDTVEQLYELLRTEQLLEAHQKYAKKLDGHEEVALLSKRLSQIDIDAPIETDWEAYRFGSRLF
ncbi:MULTISPECIES: 5'-3' exonuclease H3TH domain-containing protein [unclassified Exiguobacterium]|uniref:5'-3' exonuclease n=1 Tax=unclassified Exiguobacterium TaxID=2644629 RepID=UPI00103E4594|nr:MULTISPECIES: 5'-3' exonuclease H3TH domain-containing protein [unclassified Exiguobacterium]TCI35633.1 5'-3' exonuclease [Exiguobacterium sp. SH4S7]TCI43571.1 5'-3' exonuclease [Exiguobacterium sp. SH5S32]TCI52517.1 5'-3' exonuclease [Exiguobacterium sp. SH1S4]TCI68826.1 5'-3' exonuclease [Exiguobacterium sp. SH1S1]TCI80290.1 5'-3' exonuclease [Exiguobacterium sp. SH0S1]